MEIQEEKARKEREKINKLNSVMNDWKEALEHKKVNTFNKI